MPVANHARRQVGIIWKLSGLATCRSHARPAAAPPGLPVTYNSSPGRAPPRVSTLRGRTKPISVTSTITGPGDSRDVAARERDLMRPGDRQKPVDQRVEVIGRQVARQGQREQRHPRRGAHGRDVRQIDRKRLPADVGGGAEAAIEVDCLRPGRPSSGPRARRAPVPPPRHRRRCRRAAMPGPGAHGRRIVGNDATLAEVGDRRATARIQRRGSHG